MRTASNWLFASHPFLTLTAIILIGCAIPGALP
jgi:hypothetical protein